MHPDARQDGFTLIDLLVAVAVIAILAVTLLPALANSRTKAESVRCFSNLQQIMDAVLMYTHDYHDFFPPNPDDGNTVPGYDWCGGDVSGGTWGVGPAANTFMPDILLDPHYDLIEKYIGTNFTIFRCTADTRMGKYQPENPGNPMFTNWIGKIIPAARTISMNGAVGTVDSVFYNSGSGHGGPPDLPVNGPWLTGTHGVNRHDNPWMTYGRTSDMLAPIPARLFVVSEESPWSINDASLQISAQVPQWVDWPSTLHDGGCVMTFGDGHVELHKWVTGTLVLSGGATLKALVPTNADWIWLAQRTSYNSTGARSFPPDN